MRHDTEPAHPDDDASTDELVGLGRRPILKALGAGTALSLGTGVAAADRNDPNTPHSHSYYGYATPDARNVPKKLKPDHEVELHIADPTPGEHPLLFHFEPTGLHIACGDIVQFTFTTPDHTITAYHPGHGFQRRVPADVPPFSSPVVNAGGAWLYEFETEGLYDLYCGPHHILGMTMRIVVGDLESEDVPDYEDTFEGTEGSEDSPPLLAPFSKEFLEHELHAFSDQNEDCEWVWLTPQEVLDADALDPENIQGDDGRVAFDEVLADIDRISGGHEHD